MAGVAKSSASTRVYVRRRASTDVDARRATDVDGRRRPSTDVDALGVNGPLRWWEASDVTVQTDVCEDTIHRFIGMRNVT